MRRHGSEGHTQSEPVVLTTVRLCFAQTFTKGHRVMTRERVKEPSGKTEFEVQAYIWNELRKLGINARGEIKAKHGHRSYVRFDIAIFKDGNLKHIIEVKRSRIKHKTTWEDTRQGKRYNDFGVPVTIVYGMGDAEKIIKTFHLEE